MAVSLRWLTDRRRNLGLVVLAGAENLDRDIAYVLTSELADPTPWLSGGELILVTGLGLPETEEALDRYVRRLAARGVVAIGFGVGVSRESVPRGLLAAARAHGMPLLSVPRPTPFLAVATAVSERAETLRSRARELTARAQPKLTRAAVIGGRGALLSELAKVCEGAAILLDPRGMVVDSHPAGTAPEVLAAVTECARTTGSGTTSGLTPAGTAVIHTIRVAGRMYGHLAVVVPHEPRGTDHVLIGHTNSLLTLDFEKPRRVDDTATLVNAAALGLLVTDGADLTPVFQLASAAADPSGRIRVLTLLGAGSGTAALAHHLEQGLRAMSRPVFVTVAGDGLATVAGDAVIALLRGDDDLDAVRRLLTGLPVRIRRRLRAGLGTPAPVEETAAAAAASHTAAEAARPGGPAQDAGRLAGHTLLGLPASGEALRELAALYIEPLAGYDDEHATALVPSLHAYLENHGQWEAAAGVLGIHRHTLRARIEKTQAILGVDLDSARVRAELLLALLAHRGGDRTA